jgi:hypothetical protein
MISCNRLTVSLNLVAAKQGVPDVALAGPDPFVVKLHALMLRARVDRLLSWRNWYWLSGELPASQT